MTTPEQPKHNWIARLRVENGGYIDGIDIQFDPRGNVIMGPPGTGKSTMVGLMRYALGQPVPERKKPELDALIEANLGTGRVFVTLRTHYGKVYEFSRAGGEKEPRLESPKEPGERAPTVTDVFPMHFAGHGEFELMATDGLARLALLERFAWEDVRRMKEDLTRVRGEIDANNVERKRLDKETQELARSCAKLPAERARLEALKQAAGDDPAQLDLANKEKAERERERIMMESAAREIDWLSTEIAKLWPAARRRLTQCTDPVALAGPNGHLLADVEAHLKRTLDALEAAATEVSGVCQRAKGVVAERGQTLTELHRPQEDVYRVLLSKHEVSAARALERLDLERSVAELTRVSEDLRARAEERSVILATSDRLRARHTALKAARRELLQRAGDTIKKALDGAIEITVVPEADRTKYRQLLGSILKGKGVDAEDLDAIVKSISPEDLCAQVLAGDASVIDEKIERKTSAPANRLLGLLIESGRIYELETVEVEDIPTLKLRHGAEMKESQTLSSGQRTVAFVSLLLLDKRGPIVADQPEDNMANKYLAENLCGVIAEMQKDRQYIFVTHDGNIPILGKAKRLFDFQADGKRAWIEQQGPAAEVKEPMADNFEGGRRAFMSRKDFYGVE